MTISIVKIEFSLSVHATEDFDRNIEALANLIPENIIQESKIVVENLEGGYENPIQYVKTSFEKNKYINEILAHVFSKLSIEQKQQLNEEFEERFNFDKKTFHLRIDKHEIFHNKLIISSTTNVIKMEIKLRTYTKEANFKQFLVDQWLL